MKLTFDKIIIGFRVTMSFSLSVEMVAIILKRQVCSVATATWPLGCTFFSKCSQIKPTFLHSMCIGEIWSHAKFQVSSFNDLAWPPLFVNQSWHWESHLKWPESGTFDLAPFIGIKNALQNGITLGVLAFRKYLKRLEENW